MEIIDQDTPFNSSAYDFRAGGVQIWECGAQGYAKEAKYCCESEGERQRCCSTSSAVFRLDGATIGAFTGPSASSSSVSTTHASSSSISTTGSATTATRTSSSLVPTSTNTQTESETQNSNNGLKIGAGIGGAVGGCLLLTAGIFLFRWQKRRNEKAMESLRQELSKGQDNEEIVYGGYAPVELPASRGPHELPVSQIPQELPVEEMVHELPQRRSDFDNRNSVKQSKDQRESK